MPETGSGQHVLGLPVRPNPDAGAHAMGNGIALPDPAVSPPHHSPLGGPGDNPTQVQRAFPPLPGLAQSFFPLDSCHRYTSTWTSSAQISPILECAAPNVFPKLEVTHMLHGHLCPQACDLLPLKAQLHVLVPGSLPQSQKKCLSHPAETTHEPGGVSARVYARLTVNDHRSCPHLL